MRRLLCANAGVAAVTATASKAPSNGVRAFTMISSVSRIDDSAASGVVLLCGDSRRNAGFDHIAVKRAARIGPRRHEFHVVEQPLAADAFEAFELAQRIFVIVDAQADRRIFLGRPYRDG